MPQWVTSGTGCDYQTLVAGAALKAHPELANGLICTGYGPLPADTTNPWVAGFKKINDQYNSSNPFDGQALYGMSASASLFVQALLKAGKDLTREGLIAAVEKGGFTGAGFAPLVYSPTNHGGYTGCPHDQGHQRRAGLLRRHADDRRQERPGHRRTPRPRPTRRPT